jgi:hypothetical protein
LNSVEGGEQFVGFARRGLLRGGRPSAEDRNHENEECAEKHAGSVFRLGIERQGCPDGICAMR